MRVLWAKAPLLLLRYPQLFAALIALAGLTAVVAASAPMLHRGIESGSLQAQLRDLSPLAAGLEVRVPSGRFESDRRRREAAIRVARDVDGVGTPVVTTLIPVTAGGQVAPGLELVAMARSGALDHVQRKTGGDPGGVWIADSTARALRLRPGQTLVLTEPAYFGHTSSIAVRIAGVYRALEADCCGPFWSNWVQDIRNPHPDLPPPPAFVLMPQSTLVRVARRLHPSVENRFEFPATTTLTLDGARQLEARFRALDREIRSGNSPVRRELGCAGATGCSTNSSLSSALALATAEVATVSPTIWLLAACGLLVGLALAVTAGVFLVRRRSDEVNVLFVQGEAVAAFGTRVALESVLPATIGAAVGVVASISLLELLAPAGAVDSRVVSTGIAYGAAGGFLVIAAAAAGASAAFPRSGRRRGPGRIVLRLPWELVMIAAAVLLLALLLSGRGLAHDSTGATHPRLAVFLLPMVAVTGAAGLATRGGTRLLRGVRTASPVWLLLALRRLASGRAALAAAVVGMAVAFGMFAYASTLSASLMRSTTEKAFVATGGDVQGTVDPSAGGTASFPFPVALAQIDQSNAAFESGAPVDLVSADPAALARTLRWGNGWPNDPRRLLPRLAARSDRLLAIASSDAPNSDAVVYQGVRIPITIVGRAAIPGSRAGYPALLVSSEALRAGAARNHIPYPAPGVTGVVWAKGRPAVVERALAASTLYPFYLTTPGAITRSASVAAALRSYRYVRIVGVALSLLTLVALLLYLQVRQRSQLISSAFARRMGLTRRSDTGAVAFEAAIVMLFAGLLGGGVAALIAQAVVKHVDSLPQYAPGPVSVVPWTVLVAGLAIAVVAASFVGAAAAGIARRSDIAEALRLG
ncbi:MAG TPA: FtsX-like permease family protein [Gaiellaceae bacterium]|nr:FtsX-like permease family protein [Gaiellaceae bacterium]